MHRSAAVQKANDHEQIDGCREEGGEQIVEVLHDLYIVQHFVVGNILVLRHECR